MNAFHDDDVIGADAQLMPFFALAGVKVVAGLGDGFARHQLRQVGLKKGDIIVAFNDKKTAKMNTLRSMVAAYAVGKSATLKVMRDGKEMTLEVTIAEQPDTEGRIAARGDGERNRGEPPEVHLSPAGRCRVDAAVVIGVRPHAQLVGTALQPP